MSSEQDGDSDEETLDAMEYTETMELDTEDPDVTVNDDHTDDDVQEPHDSNSHNSKTLFSMSLLVHYGLIVACSERVICVLGNLLELAGKKCRRPDCFSVCNMSHKFSGCTLIIKGVCQQGHYFQWTSSHAINNKSGSTVHEDNMLFSIAVVLSGNNFQKIECFSNTLGLHVISRSTFHMYQRLYICPGIEKFYFKTQVRTYIHAQVLHNLNGSLCF